MNAAAPPAADVTPSKLKGSQSGADDEVAVVGDADLSHADSLGLASPPVVLQPGKVRLVVWD